MRSAKLLARYLLPVVCIWLFLSFSIVKNVSPAFPLQSTIQVRPVSAGQVRDVDAEKVKTMIRKNQLSDKEADYYQPIEKEE